MTDPLSKFSSILRGFVVISGIMSWLSACPGMSQHWCDDELASVLKLSIS